MSTIGVRLRELRGSSSQADMAKAINVKQQNWARWEGDVVAPSAEMLATICRVHACSADWLLGLTDGRETSAAKPQTPTVNLDELRATATQLAEELASLAGTIKKLKKML